jgi:hypothetical protein
MNENTRCGIAALGAVSVPWRELARLRKQPGAAALTPHLKMADEQTVVAAVALWQAVASAGWQEHCFRDWGVIAAPRYPGRMRVAALCERYRKNLRGFSPLVIPHQSLHSVAGTLSIALAIHGPNFGVGGGPDHVAEALLTGLGMVQNRALPGLWVVCSDMDPEPVPNSTGEIEAPTVAHAFALALTAEAGAGLTLELQTTPAVRGAAPLRVQELVTFVESGGVTPWQGAADGIGQFVVRPSPAASLRLAS